MIHRVLSAARRDPWKTWIKDGLEWAGYVGLGILIAGVIFFFLIILESEINHAFIFFG